MMDEVDIKRIAGEVADRVNPAINEVKRSVNAEAGRFERRVEGWSTWQTVGAAVATFVAGLALGALAL